MEPLSALAVATSIVQFIDFSSKIVSGSRELYKSSNGLSSDHTDLLVITTNLSKLSESFSRPVQSSSSAPQIDQLRELSQNANQVARELIATLDGIRLEKGTRWESCYKALRSVWTQQQINMLQGKLNGFRQQLTLSIVVILRYGLLHYVATILLSYA